MIYILLLLSIAAYVVLMLGMGGLSKKVFKNSADQLLFQVILNGLCFLLMLIVFRKVRPSGFTLLLSAAMGAAQLISMACSMAAYRRGPVSISVMVTSSLAMVISALSGPVFWGEAISVLQIVGILLSVTSMILLTERALIKKASAGWVMALLLAGFGGGMQGTLQKVLATSACAGESSEFITGSFLFAAFAAGILLFAAGKKGNERISFSPDPKLLFSFVLLAGLSVFLNINNLKLVSELPTVLFFPAYVIGSLMVTTIASAFLFREKMSLRQTAGFLCGLAALFLISGILGSV